MNNKKTYGTGCDQLRKGPPVSLLRQWILQNDQSASQKHRDPPSLLLLLLLLLYLFMR